MIVTNTRLLRGQLLAAAAELSKPHAWDGRYELVVEGGQVRLRPAPASSAPSEAAGVAS